MKKWLLLSLLLSTNPAFSSPSVEMLHWWTAAGEEKAWSVIEKQFESLPYTLKSEPISGGGGAPAKAILQARAIAGYSPDIALMEGPAIQSWAALGFLNDVNEVAESQRWDQSLYPDIKAIHQYDGNFVAIPLNIHRLNWMWINKKVLNQHQLSSPQTWDSLLLALTTLKSKGVNPLALGEDSWQIVQVFENIAFGVGGANYYRQAFVDLDPDALNSDKTLEALKRFRSLANIVGSDLPSISWDQGTKSLLEGEFAFQFTGDWALGEMFISAEGEIPDYIECRAFPSTEKGFIYNVDSLAFFTKVTGEDHNMVSVLTSLSSPQFLLDFSKKKGSIPAQANIPVNELSRCQQQSYQDYIHASSEGTAMPSLTDSMAVNPVLQNAVSNELYRYFMDSSISAETLIGHLHAINNEVFR
ncbi:ABC transporter substrate-binding protein [Vibrio sp. 10N.222.54.F12]|uniref:ABC transporter substrate-binding protein n=1 Tax=Vibrio TaxID=662 RepID=UPI000C830EF5|nr:ABC transporter substrate-binding protein [Vibrio tasmaniensis]PML16414.1 sugar ABC transporter substrate-binding protein [Vibrio tasmaniensis]PML46092.1 sugar ABC transporter substrate-binding protein [Vibrio tasmaniensis]